MPATWATALQAEVLALHNEIRGIEEKNLATLGGAEGNPALAKIVLLPYPRDKYVFWAGLFGDSRTGSPAEKGRPSSAVCRRQIWTGSCTASGRLTSRS